MTHAIREFESFHAEIDPHNKYDIPTNELIAWCGYLPGWAAQYFTLLNQFNRAKEEGGEGEIPTLKEHMDEVYGFGPLIEMTGGTVAEGYVHQYPEDPDIYPFIVMQSKHGPEMVQWQSGIVAFRQSAEDEWFITRMD